MTEPGLTCFLLADSSLLAYGSNMKQILKIVVAILTVVSLWSGVIGLASAGNRSVINPVIVELFTSQGCSSCPPADALLGTLADREDVLGLSFHVDYWDYIGWRDPFASKLNTLRQRLYVKALSGPYVYTPQIVIDGRMDAMGSNKSEVFSSIAFAGKQMKLALSKNSKGEIVLPEDTNGRNSTIWLVFFDSSHTTKVLKGENVGRTITNSNVVRSIQDLGEWNGEARTLTIPDFPSDGYAVLIQSAADFGHGPIRASYAEIQE
jgi:hypothetical protein